MFCESCGKKLLAGTRFCVDCGAEIERAGGSVPAPTAGWEPARQAPSPHSPSDAFDAASGEKEPLTMGQYLLIFLLLSIPLLNIVLLFLWSFGRNVNINKRNFARASLGVCLIMSVVYVFVVLSMAGYRT